MKAAFSTLCFVGLALLVGCATAGPSPSSADGIAKWTVLPGFRQYGITFVAYPHAVVTTPVDLAFLAGSDVDLLVMAVETGTTNVVNVLLEKGGGLQKARLDLKKSGEYDITLVGKPTSVKTDQWTVLATTHVTARITAPATVAVSDTAPTAAFERYGLAFVSPPVTRVGEEASLVISRPKEFPIAYGFSNAAGASATDGVDVSSDAGEIRVLFAFSESGDYTFTLYGKPSKESSGSYESLVSVTFHATVDPSRVPVLPANWKAGPGFRRFGVALTAAPEKAARDLVRFAFTTSKEISLSGSLRNTTRNKGESEMPSGVSETNVKGTQCSGAIFFPESGEYDLWLWGKAAGEKDYVKIARVSFSAEVTDRTGVLPANWTALPRFWSYDLKAVSTPDRAVGEATNVTFEVPTGLTLSASLRNIATGKYLWTVATEAAGSRQTISALFPACGEYELILSGKAETEEYSRELARAAFVASFDESVPRYRLWRTGGAWPLVPVPAAQTVTGAWKPRGQWSEVTTHLKGALSTDFAIPVGDSSVPLRKGTVVEFSMNEGQPIVSSLQFPLPRDRAQSVDGTTVTFKAGTPFAVQSYGVAGVLARDAKLPLAGGEITCLKGSRLVVDSDSLSEIQLAGKASLSFQGARYECTGTVIVQSSCFGEGVGLASVVLSKAAAVQLGTARISLPAQSLLTFSKDGIDHVLVSQDVSVLFNGETRTIPAGWAARLTDKGELETYKTEE